MASANSIFISISSSMVERWQWIMFFPFFSDQRTKAPDNLTPISYRRSFWRSGPCYRPQLLKSVNSSSKRLEFGRKSSNSTWTKGKKRETLALNRLVFLFEFQPFQIQGRNHGKNLGATSAMVGRICPPPGCNSVKVSQNSGATTVAPVTLVDTSLKFECNLLFRYQSFDNCVWCKLQYKYQEILGRRKHVQCLKNKTCAV